MLIAKDYFHGLLINATETFGDNARAFCFLCQFKGVLSPMNAFFNKESKFLQSQGQRM
jgi:hypothetical protein